MTNILKYALKPAAILALALSVAYIILFYASKETYIHPKSGIVMMLVTTVVVIWTGFRMAVRHRPSIGYPQAWVFTFVVITVSPLRDISELGPAMVISSCTWVTLSMFLTRFMAR